MSTIDISHYLKEQEQKSQLKFITCGSVDDGKSTLLGRLLYDSKLIFEDHFLAVQTESKKYGTQGENIDLALLVDGLQAEREQGITIDVAYRYFETPKRKFIAADCPGHEQYTRNMVTGASSAEAAVILVDAAKGIITQTRRHSFIVGLMGIEQVIVAINKMDLVDYSEDIYQNICQDYQSLTDHLSIPHVHFIPLSALNGDNVFHPSTCMPWYQGRTLMDTLELIEIKPPSNQAFRFPIQWVNRPHSNFRGYAGKITSGNIKVGDSIYSSLTGQTSKVTSILTPQGEAVQAQNPQSITLTVADEIDISRGDLLTNTVDIITPSDHFAAQIIWLDPDPLIRSRNYKILFSTSAAIAQITHIEYKVDINSQNKLAAKNLQINDIGYCKISLNQKLPFDAYAHYRETGSFILVDLYSNNTVAAGMVQFSLYRSDNIHWQKVKVNKTLRANLLKQKPVTLWFTGLSGSGKSTVADALEQKLHQMGKLTYLLDGDNIRHGLNKDLGFTPADRAENIRRIGEVAKLMTDAGLIVIVAFISPYKAEREMVRNLFEEGEFIEIFMDTPLEICEQRDPKGLYQKARKGELKNFTGIDSEYQAPENPELILKSTDTTVDVMVVKIISFIHSTPS